MTISLSGAARRGPQARCRAARSVLPAVVLTLVLVALTDSAAAASTSPTCEEQHVAVNAPLPGLTITGSLCWRGAAIPATVELLLPGGTYNRVYWDFPYRPDRYSYVSAATAGGVATFDVDRLGTGASSHPLGALLTNTSEAAATHQVVTALRSGRVGGTRFTRVILAGHSYGSVVAWYEAGTYHDVDAVMITGLLHTLSPPGAAAIATFLYPAGLDPKFHGRGLDPDYLTTRPGTRQSFFYGPDPDPNVVAADEATKDTATTTEAAGLATGLTSGMSSDINVPVLVAVGQDDLVFCGTAAADCSSAHTVLAHEAPAYPRAPCLDTFVLPDSGHDLNTAPDAPDWFAAAVTWTAKAAGAAPCG